MNSALDKEMDTFNQVLPGLLADPDKNGKFVLIRGDQVAGFYDTQNEAIDAGYLTFGIVPFLTRRIIEREEPLYFPRMVYHADHHGSPQSGGSRC